MAEQLFPLAKSKVLIECLPYLREFHNQTVVIKYGGHATTDAALKKAFALNIALLKLVGVNPVVVHGGGPQIGKRLEQLNIQSSFLEGQRITDDATMDVVEMVLVGTVNQEIVSLMNTSGVTAVGVSGKDGRTIMAQRLEIVLNRKDAPPEILNIGKVGEVARVNTELLSTLQQSGFVPVIAPVGTDENGETYNINADSVAGAVAGALRAKRLLLLTDVPGILDKDKELIRSLTRKQALALFEDNTVFGGMIPKVKCCLEALEEGVEKAMIIDGRVENCILLELLTDAGIGTEIVHKSNDAGGGTVSAKPGS